MTITSFQANTSLDPIFVLLISVDRPGQAHHSGHWGVVRVWSPKDFFVWTKNNNYYTTWSYIIHWFEATIRKGGMNMSVCFAGWLARISSSSCALIASLVSERAFNILPYNCVLGWEDQWNLLVNLATCQPLFGLWILIYNTKEPLKRFLVLADLWTWTWLNKHYSHLIAADAVVQPQDTQHYTTHFHLSLHHLQITLRYHIFSILTVQLIFCCLIKQ